MSEWISVEERFPEPGERVIIVIGGIVQHTMAFIDDGRWEWADFDSDSAPMEAVSHWMPLPDPPKAKP